MVERSPACGGAMHPFLTSTDRNRRVSEVSFAYDRCTTCGLVALVDPPADLGAYYGDEYYQQPPLADLERVASREAYQIDMVRRHVGGGRLVEIGPAWGVFALQAKRAGFDVIALEQDTNCCEYLRDTVGVDARRTDRPERELAGLDSVDVVALWQVIEHLPDPWATLEAAAGALREHGVLVVATPNPDALGFRLMRSRWPHLDAPRHLWLLPLDVLVERARALGLEVVTLSFDDAGARSWNRFAWQRLLMNHFRGRNAQRAAFVVGSVLAAVASPFERGGRRSSSYTVILRKAPAR